MLLRLVLETPRFQIPNRVAGSRRVVRIERGPGPARQRLQPNDLPILSGDARAFDRRTHFLAEVLRVLRVEADELLEVLAVLDAKEIVVTASGLFVRQAQLPRCLYEPPVGPDDGRLGLRERYQLADRSFVGQGNMRGFLADFPLFDVLPSALAVRDTPALDLLGLNVEVWVDAR